MPPSLCLLALPCPPFLRTHTCHPRAAHPAMPDNQGCPSNKQQPQQQEALAPASQARPARARPHTSQSSSPKKVAQMPPSLCTPSQPPPAGLA